MSKYKFDTKKLENNSIEVLAHNAKKAAEGSLQSYNLLLLNGYLYDSENSNENVHVYTKKDLNSFIVCKEYVALKWFN